MTRTRRHRELESEASDRLEEGRDYTVEEHGETKTKRYDTQFVEQSKEIMNNTRLHKL